MLTTMVFATDVARMRAFYEHVFDLSVDAGETSDGYVVLLGPHCRLALHAIPPEVAAGISIDDPPAARTESPIKPVFAVDDVHAAGARVGARGGRIIGSPFAGALDAVDPEGNVVGIVGT